MSKVPLYQTKNNKSFSPNIRIWLYSVLQLLQLFNKNCCKGAAIFGVPLLWLCTTAVTHIIIITIIIIIIRNIVAMGPGNLLLVIPNLSYGRRGRNDNRCQNVNSCAHRELSFYTKYQTLSDKFMLNIRLAPIPSLNYTKTRKHQTRTIPF